MLETTCLWGNLLHSICHQPYRLLVQQALCLLDLGSWYNIRALFQFCDLKFWKRADNFNNVAVSPLYLGLQQKCNHCRALERRSIVVVWKLWAMFVINKQVAVRTRSTRWAVYSPRTQGSHSSCPSILIMARGGRAQKCAENLALIEKIGINTTGCVGGNINVGKRGGSKAGPMDVLHSQPNRKRRYR